MDLLGCDDLGGVLQQTFKDVDRFPYSTRYEVTEERNIGISDVPVRDPAVAGSARVPGFSAVNQAEPERRCPPGAARGCGFAGAIGVAASALHGGERSTSGSGWRSPSGMPTERISFARRTSTTCPGSPMPQPRSCAAAASSAHGAPGGPSPAPSVSATASTADPRAQSASVHPAASGSSIPAWTARAADAPGCRWWRGSAAACTSMSMEPMP